MRISRSNLIASRFLPSPTSWEPCPQSRERGEGRRGFTLVELLVAAAVSLVLMVILTEAFKRGIDMFRTLRAQGQMMERLRVGTTAMRDDLASFHFYDAFSTDKLYVNGQRADQASFVPPTDGFFRIIQGNDPVTGVPFVAEGTDRESILFTRCTTHALHFTVFRRETSPTVKFPVDPSYLFRVSEPDRLADPLQVPQPVPPPFFPRDYIDPPNLQESNVFGSRWAEVAYFLVPNGNSAGGTPLFNLIRRAKSVLPPPNLPLGIMNLPPRASLPAQGIQENFDISTRSQLGAGNQQGRFYNFAGSITQPRYRMCMGPAVDANDPYSAGLYSPKVPVPTTPVSNQPPGSSYWPIAVDLASANPPRADTQAGDDILLSDVISFEVKATWDVPTAAAIAAGIPAMPEPSHVIVVPGINPPGNQWPNTDYPFDYLPLSPTNRVLSNQMRVRVFDTWTSQDFYGQGAPAAWQDTNPNTPDGQTGARIPLRIRVKAVMIRIRIWDAKAEQTRQLTIIQDL